MKEEFYQTLVKDRLAQRKEIKPHPQYIPNPSWLPPLFQTNFLKQPKRKSLCDRSTLNRITSCMNKIGTAHRNVIITDGSVNTSNGHSGAALHCSTHASAWRLSDGCSTWQIFRNRESCTTCPVHNLKRNINTDSLPAIQALLKPPDENIGLITTILFKIKHFHARNSVSLTWIPSLIGISRKLRSRPCRF